LDDSFWINFFIFHGNGFHDDKTTLFNDSQLLKSLIRMVFTERSTFINIIRFNPWNLEQPWIVD
jgi:hypothetical protein